jgi:hypothetical protein
VVQGGEQVDFPALGLGRPAQALAVHGQTVQAVCSVGAAVGKPAAHGLVQGVAIDPGQESANRRFRRQQPLRTQWIGTRANSLEHLGRSVGDPLADRRQRSRPGQYRARGQGERDHQSVPHSARITRVRHLGQPFQQARYFSGCDLRVVAELVKSGRDRR